MARFVFCFLATASFLGITAPARPCGFNQLGVVDSVVARDHGGSTSDSSLGLALSLMKARKFAAAIPWLERSIGGDAAGPGLCVKRLALAKCLFGGASESSDRLGLPAPERVSRARVLAVKAAICQLDSAEMIAPSAFMLSTVRLHRGYMLEVSGFPLDAYGWYRAALRADPSNLDASKRLGGVSRFLILPSADTALQRTH